MRAWGRALRLTAAVIGTTMAGELLHMSLTALGWSRPDAGFLAALTAGGLEGALVVAYLAHRLRDGPGAPGPSRTARWGALAGTLVAAWLMALAWLEGGVWLTPQLVLWLWPGALLLAPVPTSFLAPAVSATWLAIAMAANALVYTLAATVGRLAAAARRGRQAAVPPELCALGLGLGVLSWLTPLVAPGQELTGTVAVLGLGGVALGLLAPEHGALAAAAALPGLLLPALVETLLAGAGSPAAGVAREVVRAASVAGAGVGAALAAGGLSRLARRT